MEYLKLAHIGSGFAQLWLPIPENHPKLKLLVAPPDFSSPAAPRCPTFAHQRLPNARSARNSNEPAPGLSGDCSGRPLPGCGRRARDGRNLEVVGHYNPRTTPALVHLNYERISHWVGVGAQMSDTVARLVKKNPAAQPAA